MPMAIDVRTITANELESMHFDDGTTELIRGEVIEMSPPAFEHGDIQMTFGALLKNHVKARNLGRVIGEAGFILETGPDTVLAPDIAFISHERLNASSRPRSRFQDVAPELVVEIVSPSDLAVHINRKASIYIAAGVQLVIQVWPEERTLTLISSTQTSRTIRAEETLDLSDTIAGFICQVSDIFE